MLIQWFSLIKKKRDAIVVKIRPYIVLITIDVRCDNRNVTITVVFHPDQFEYLPCDKPDLSSFVRRRYNPNIIRRVKFRWFKLKYITLDMSKLRTA